MPVAPELLSIYDGQYYWDLGNPRGYGNRMGRYRTQMECDFMQRHLGAPAQRVLDVGGGSGRLGKFIKSLGHRVTVVDCNPLAIAMAETCGLEGAVVCDVMAYDGRDFDVTVCMEVIEYFEDCAPIIAKCSEFTKPGGLFLFCVINANSWRFQLGKFRQCDHPGRAFALSAVAQALRAAGLELLERRGFQWCLAPTSSDSRLVTFSAAIENFLGLHRWQAQSPWLLYACRKIK